MLLEDVLEGLISKSLSLFLFSLFTSRHVTDEKESLVDFFLSYCPWVWNDSELKKSIPSLSFSSLSDHVTDIQKMIGL